MPTYEAPIRDMQFLLNDVLQIQKYSNLPGFADASPDVVDAILQEAAKVCQDVLQPLNQIGDRQGCTFKDGEVTTPEGFKEAYATFVEGGWPSLACDPEFGGQGLPHVVNSCVMEMVSSANMAFGMYPGLSHGAYAALSMHGTDDLKQTYLPKLVSGEWTGTMNLTEPHCGTDLGLMRTKAEPAGDGSFSITGTKIFISAGEHDLVDNIVHLVLAKITDAPEGIKGVSLFVVPKFLVNEDGSLGARNGVSCGSIEHKMGINGNATCVLNFESAKGWLIGEENKGMRAMFTMMNEARLGVGLQGLSQSETSYQNAAIYAKERVQGRSLTGAKAPEQAADPILVHPDVRRMLLDQKSFNEAARAFVLWTSLRGDISTKSPDENERESAEDAMGLLTPVIKGHLTDRGFLRSVDAQQVYGGHGYIGEWGMEQFVRDARISMIYEGANGVQALDLVGRKLVQNGGRALTAYLDEIDRFIDENQDDEGLIPFTSALVEGKARLVEATDWLMQNALEDLDNAGAASTDYMHLFGIVSLGFMWALMAKAALAQKAQGGTDPFYERKIATGRYYVERVMPETAAHLAKIQAGSGAMMALEADAF
jgi:hypothetical protein